MNHNIMIPLQKYIPDETLAYNIPISSIPCGNREINVLFNQNIPFASPEFIEKLRDENKIDDEWSSIYKELYNKK